MDTKALPFIRLDLFDGGAAGAAAAGGEGAGAAQGETPALPGSTRRGKSGDLSNVVYGKQDAASGAGASAAGGQNGQGDTITTSDTLEAKRRAYNDLIQGEYKDLYTEDTQRMINRRFRETKDLESRLSQTQPVIDMLMERYGINDGDVAKLTEALDSDDAYWADAADNAGMSVEQYKKYKKLERENKQLTQSMQRAAGEVRAQNQIQQWFEQGEAVRARYPGFDLKEECANPHFLAMLKSGVPVEHAYKVMHLDEILSDVSRTSAASAEDRVVDSIRAKGARPRENGTAAKAAFTVRDDVSQLSRKDRAEIARRVARGERIAF